MFVSCRDYEVKANIVRTRYTFVQLLWMLIKLFSAIDTPAQGAHIGHGIM